jgi:hypothetical protein
MSGLEAILLVGAVTIVLVLGVAYFSTECPKADRVRKRNLPLTCNASSLHS